MSAPRNLLLISSSILLAGVLLLPSTSFAKAYSMTGTQKHSCCDHVFVGGLDQGPIVLNDVPNVDGTHPPDGSVVLQGTGYQGTGYVAATDVSAPFNFTMPSNQIGAHYNVSQAMATGRLLLTSMQNVFNGQGNFQKNFIAGGQTGANLGNFSFCPPADILGTSNPNPENPNCGAVIAGQAYNGRFTGMQGQANHFGGTMKLMGTYSGHVIFQIGAATAYRQFFNFPAPMFYGGNDYGEFTIVSQTATIIALPGQTAIGGTFPVPVRISGVPWFTGTVMASATRVSFGTRHVNTETGTDARDAMGEGNISMVSALNFNLFATGLLGFPNTSKLTLNLPEPAMGAGVMVGAAALMMAYRRRMDR